MHVERNIHAHRRTHIHNQPPTHTHPHTHTLSVVGWGFISSQGANGEQLESAARAESGPDTAGLTH